MITDKLTNATVKSAIDALQIGNTTVWLALFSPEIKLYDDGNPRDFKEFTRSAIGHERFVSIEKVEQAGLYVYGKFHSDQWGDFKTYFKFEINSKGQIIRLDIGQAN